MVMGRNRWEHTYSNSNKILRGRYDTIRQYWSQQVSREIEEQAEIVGEATNRCSQTPYSLNKTLPVQCMLKKEAESKNTKSNNACLKKYDGYQPVYKKIGI